jgi:hypothetical protein
VCTQLQIRSLGTAVNLASSWKASAGWGGRPLRQAQVGQGRTLTASLTEQSKHVAPDSDLMLWDSGPTAVIAGHASA